MPRTAHTLCRRGYSRLKATKSLKRVLLTSQKEPFNQADICRRAHRTVSRPSPLARDDERPRTCVITCAAQPTDYRKNWFARELLDAALLASPGSPAGPTQRPSVRLRVAHAHALASG